MKLNNMYADILLGSVGMFAVQLVHAAGYKIVATCSPRNFELVKSFGADAVFDVRICAKSCILRSLITLL